MQRARRAFDWLTIAPKRSVKMYHHFSDEWLQIDTNTFFFGMHGRRGTKQQYILRCTTRAILSPSTWKVGPPHTF